MADEVRVVFTPSGRRGTVAAGTSVLDAARLLGVDLDSVCGGRGICGRCQVAPQHGAFPKHGLVSGPEALTPVGADEQRYAALRGLCAGRRLGCQARICADALIDVPPDSQMHRQVVRKAAEAHDITLDPVVRLCCVAVRQPDMHDPASDFARLQQALSTAFALPPVTADLAVLRTLQKTLRAGAWQVTVAIREGSRLVALYPGLVTGIYGLAIDIGSTTLAVQLVDLTSGAVVGTAGCMNPQIRFGDDLMSRVSHIMLHPGSDAALTEVVRTALDALVGEVADAAGIARQRIVEATVVGNPIMHHLLLGLDPTELGGAPFALTLDGSLDVPARELGLSLAPGAMVHVLPCIAGHVGADTAGVLLAEAPEAGDGLTLIVDVGTNAEIVLGDADRLLACSSPTGPAFEGAQISAGQRAAVGAIELLRIDPETLEPRYRLIGCDLWSDDPGFEAATAGQGVTGICGSGIIEAVGEMLRAGILRADGIIDGALAARSPRIEATGRTFSYLLREGTPRIAVTQADIRAIQLAKAALHAGCKLLMHRFPGRSIARIRLAGAFGSHIDVRYAMLLGLIPDCPLEAVSSAGNAAGTGARIALINRAARETIAGLVRRIEKIETALEAEFQAEFVAAMAFPHASDPYPNLRAAMSLPAPPAGADEPPRRRRRERN